MDQVPQLTLEQAREAKDKIIALFEEPANRARLEGIVQQFSAPDQVPMRNMTLMMEVNGMAAPIMQEYGFPPGAPGVMAAVMQFQMLAAQGNQDIAEFVTMLTAKMQGNL